MYRAALFLIAIVLSSCVPAEEAPTIGPELADRAEAACARDGGRWTQRSDSVTMVCFRTPPDANKQCTTRADCTTQCLARSRTCAPVTPLFGCNEVIGLDGAVSTLCIE